MNKKIWFFVLLTLLTLPRFAAAEPSPWTEERSYFKKSTGKLGYGLSNVVRGFAEPYVHVVKAGQNDRNAFTGLIRGTAYGVADIVGGAAHAVTFLFPFDIPLPEGGAHGFSRNVSYF